MNLTRKYVTSSAVFAVAISLSLVWSIPSWATTSTPFKHPGAIALDHHGHLWIANQDYFGITEIQASTGKVIRLVNAKADGFIDPSGIAVSGNTVWIVSGSVVDVNGTSNYGMVTELNATTGGLVRTVNLKKYGVTGFSAVSADAQHVWVTADGGEQVVELSNATGKVVRVFRSRQVFGSPISGIATDGSHVWIPSPKPGETGGSGGMVERSAVTGAKIRTITPMEMVVPPGGGNKLPVYLRPRFVTVGAHYIWTANDAGSNGRSVTQINAATGGIVRSIDTAADGFHSSISSINSIVSDGIHVWIVNGSTSTSLGGSWGDSVTELNASNGSLVRVVHLRNGIHSNPVGLVSNGVDVWVTDQGGGANGIGSVIELNALTGVVVRVIGA